ncbi:MAG: 2Fe-2S iron-sulfur cluster binding domain-containing protein [Rhodospirillales bacterium]|nr:2Fe-2S iron-sulfur cluster binding domain-containing protein [Rhodospirillales bacterium]
MVKITFVSADENIRMLEIAEGLSIMEGATANGIAAIAADCGGACACATCKVLVDPEWVQIVGPPSEMEQAMLDMELADTTNARLSCQIKVTMALDGLVLRTPDSQY